MVAGGEHAADGAEDYDGEDGDDDAEWAGSLVYVCSSLYFPFNLVSHSWVFAYHVHALKAETTGFMIAGSAALSGVGERFARVSMGGGFISGGSRVGYECGGGVVANVRCGGGGERAW